MTTAHNYAAFARGEYDNTKIAGTHSYHRAQKLRKRYNMTVEQFDAIKAEQGGKCPICREREATVVDHCHTNGHTRGILCPQCNGAIGMLKDDPINLLRAVEYLLLDLAVDG